MARYNNRLEMLVGVDLGTRDKCVLVFAQYDNLFDQIIVLGSYSNNYQPIEHYMDMMNSYCDERGWMRPGKIYIPHDATKQRIETMTSVDQMLQDRGFNTIVVPKINEKIIAINKVRANFHKCVFNDDSFKMFEMLKAHEKRLDKTTGLYTDIPVHGKASDYADSFETLIRGLEIDHTMANTITSIEARYM